MASDVPVWGFLVPREWLSQAEVDYLSALPKNLPTVEWVWEEMDRVWAEYELDNTRALKSQSIASFYSHPVWLMNGIFTSLDPASKAHRVAIAHFLTISGRAGTIADYGGGFGELARILVQTDPGVSVVIVEPYPSRVGVERLRNERRISFVSELADAEYDAIIAQDVLEHVEDPVALASEIAGAVKVNGTVIFANCFYPFINCHLPSTFYLRHTFRWVAVALGLKYLGRVEGVEHAQVFERTGKINLSRARTVGRICRPVGRMVNTVRQVLGRIKRLVVRP